MLRGGESTQELIHAADDGRRCSSSFLSCLGTILLLSKLSLYWGLHCGIQHSKRLQPLISEPVETIE
jgi:hypothetical protein